MIHNSADPIAAVVDLYVNDDTKLDNVAFRDATGYLELPAGQEIRISVNGSESMDSEDQRVTELTFDPLMEGGEYILIANGVVGDGFENPSMERSIAFNIFPVEGRRTGSDNMNFDVRVWHGSTDAPAVDIYANTSNMPIFPNLDYTESQGWVGLGEATYDLTLNVAGTETAAGTWVAPITSGLLWSNRCYSCIWILVT